MSDLITQKDYTERIDCESLEALLRDDALSKEEILMDAEATAFSMIDTQLRKRYDTRGIFKASFQKDKSVLKEWTVSIALHLLYKRSCKEVPGKIALNYTATLKDLEHLVLGKQRIDLPEKPKHKSEEELLHEDWLSGFDFDGHLDFGG